MFFACFFSSPSLPFQEFVQFFFSPPHLINFFQIRFNVFLFPNVFFALPEYILTCQFQSNIYSVHQ